MDKKINIKITANSSGFDKAVKSAQKSIDSLSKTQDKLGKSNVGKNISKQFDNITKSSKKADKQLESSQKTLESISKTKLSKLNKEFTNSEKGSKKFDKQLESNQKSLKEIAKAKLSNLTKQFSKTEKSGKNLNKEMESTKKTVESINKVKLSNTEKQFKTVEKAADNMGEAIEDAGESFRKLERVDIDDIEDDLKDIADSVEDAEDSFSDLIRMIDRLEDSLSDIDADIFVDLNRDIDKLENNVSSLSDDFENLGDDISDIDSGNAFIDLNRDVDKLENNMDSLSDDFSELKSDISKIDSGNAFADLISDVSKLDNKIDPLNSEIKELDNALDRIDDNDFSKLLGSTEGLESSASKAAESFGIMGQSLGDIATGKLSQLSSNMGTVGTATVAATSATRAFSVAALASGVGVTTLITKIVSMSAKVNQNKQEMSGLNEEMDDLASRAQKISSKYAEYNSRLSETVDRMTKLTDEIGRVDVVTEEQIVELNRLNKEYDEITSGVGELEKEYGELTKEIDKLTKKFTEKSKLNDQEEQALEELVKMYNEAAKAAGKEEKSLEEIVEAANKAEEATEDLADATEDLADAQDDSSKSINKWAEAFGKIKDIIGKIKSGDLKGAFESFKEISFEKVAKGANKLGEFISSAGSKMIEFGAQATASGSKFGGLITKLGTGIKGLGSLLAGVSATAVAVFAAVAAAIVAVIAATNKLYEAGKKQFFEGLSNIKAKFQPVINIFKNIGQELKQTFETLTGMTLDLSGAILVGIEFESQMLKVKAIAGATDEEFKVLEATARQWGATTRYSATEAAQAMEYMGMAGWSVQEVISGMGGVLNLATVASMDLAEASDFVTDALTALGMHASQSGDMVDMLAATSTKANTSVAQMKSAFTNVAPIAGTLGISLSDLSVSLGLMANQGVKAQKAGTALKNLLSNMASPTDTMVECIKKYNLESAQTLIKNGQLIDGIREMKTQLDGLEAAEKAAVITTIAGKEALSGVAALMNSSHKDIMNLKFAVDSSTKSGKMYAQSLGLIDEKGKVVVEDFSNMTEAQEKAYSQWQNFNGILEETSDTMALVGGSTTDLGAIVQKLGEDGEVTAEQVNQVLDVFEKMKSGNKEVTKALKDYNIELEYAEDGSFDFGETLKNLGKKWDTLTDAQKKSLAEQIGFTGSVDQLNELFSDQGETIESLVDAYESCESVAEHMARTFDATLKGSVLSLSSAIQEQLLQVFDKFKPAVQSVVDDFTEFFNIWNGMSSVNKDLKGFGDAIGWLEKKSKGWGKAISKGITDAISGISDFVNGNSFKSVLDIGTNIVQGICDGIMKSKDNGSLDSAIDGFITNICDWIVKNGPAIEEAGKTIIDSITDGISRNEMAIDEAMDSLCSIIGSWAGSSGELKATAGKFGEQFVKLALESMWNGFKSWGKEKLFAFADIFSPDNYFGSGLGGPVGTLIHKLCESMFGKDPIKQAEMWLKEKFRNFNLLQTIKDFFLPKAYADSGDSSSQIKPEQLIKIPSLDDIKGYIKEKIGNFDVKGFIKSLLVTGAGTLGGIASSVIKVADLINIPSLGEIKEYITSKFSGFSIKDFIKNLLITGGSMGGGIGAVGGALLKAADLFGDWNPVEDIKGWLDSKLGDWSVYKWFKEKIGKGKDGKGEKIDVGELLQLDPTKLAEIENSLNSLSTTASTVATNVVTAFNNITNNARTQFTNLTNIARNQFVNLANIVRNQMVNSANIVRNQCVNMANIFRNQFVSMANVARNQMVNVSNIIRNQAVNWSNIIRNQVTNARNALTSQFLSMAAVARTQMVNISNIVRNQAVTWANIIRNQSSNMKSSFTSAFSGLSSVASSQMSKCLSIVRSYMSQIAAACSRSLKINVSVNKTTTNTTVNRTVTESSLASAFGAINSAGVMANSSYVSPSSNQALARSASSISLGQLAAGAANVSQKDHVSIEIPVTLDGREVARATAVYMNGELKKIETRSNRRRGE